MRFGVGWGWKEACLHASPSASRDDFWAKAAAALRDSAGGKHPPTHSAGWVLRREKRGLRGQDKMRTVLHRAVDCVWLGRRSCVRVASSFLPTLHACINQPETHPLNPSPSVLQAHPPPPPLDHHKEAAQHMDFAVYVLARLQVTHPPTQSPTHPPQPTHPHKPRPAWNASSLSCPKKHKNAWKEDRYSTDPWLLSHPPTHPRV